MLIFFSGSVKWTTGKDYTIRNTQRFARQRLWKNSRSCKGISFFESNMILGNISFYPHDNSWGSTIESVICMYSIPFGST